MYRTTIMLPETLKMQAEKEAEREEVSFGELIRRALQKYLFAQRDPWKHDSFFSSATAFDGGPADGAKLHDHYLYGLGVDVHRKTR